MDLTQTKLSREEWETIEIPVEENEKNILQIICKGYHDANYHTNESLSLFSFVKVEHTPESEFFLYKKYFEDSIQEIITKYGKGIKLDHELTQLDKRGGGQLKRMKSADMIRIQNLDATIQTNRGKIFEYLLLDLSKDMLKYFFKKKPKYAFFLYTLLQLRKTSIRSQNQYVVCAVNKMILYTTAQTKLCNIISNAYDFIEKNPYILKYQDQTLFQHQKELFTICKNNTDTSKLILYTAPTGTGKTISPLGLVEQYRVIFVCVSRHIGLALARSAISMEKKVAFAFGCNTASDIRLHYFSALNYTKNKRSGGIGKVDNSVGNNVELMICDVQSYLTAMHYMLAFNSAESIITYWDEPTITMDCKEHPLHQVIHNNWIHNKIPNLVLSCATLPSSDELLPIFDDFRSKFENVEIYTITSFDCRKSIPILNKDGYCVLPHYLYADYTQVIACVEFCKNNKTLLRYFDLPEIIRFIEYIISNKYIPEIYSIDSYFDNNIANITMNSLKEYYLDVVLHIESANWKVIYDYMNSTKRQKFETSYINKTVSLDRMNVPVTIGLPLSRTQSVSSIIPATQSNHNPGNGIMLTTSDAYTLTDGPTIFLADDVNKIGQFYVSQSKIPSTILDNILLKISHNDEISKKITLLERLISAKEDKSTNDNDAKDKPKNQFSSRICKEVQEWVNEIEKLQKEIKPVSLDQVYVPNTPAHQQFWGHNKEFRPEAFSANIGEEMSRSIILLDIDINLKILLLLGIGVLIKNPDIHYMEIMKQLAAQQRLFIIIASTDYIYGTNYQFCHGFIGKDLTNMTQQKTLQAMGRIGRNNIQQNYTLRFRDDSIIHNLFQKSPHNLEAENMCLLFSSN